MKTYKALVFENEGSYNIMLNEPWGPNITGTDLASAKVKFGEALEIAICVNKMRHGGGLLPFQINYKMMKQIGTNERLD